jgi:acetylornithine deacetylase/succinyl-diaminopimelate desuccinylase-like protein
MSDHHRAEAVAAASRWIESRGAEILAEFARLVSIPNVSSDRIGVEATAARVDEMLKQRDLDVDVLEMPGAAPIVSARFTVSEDAPTIGIYAHYDGQPVDPEQWRTPPFEATILDGARIVPASAAGEPIDPEWRIHGRSTSDDRAPIQALVSAIDAMTEAAILPTVNLVTLFEGEEEAGSRHLADYLATHADRFAADLWLICDGPVHQSGAPQVIFGVRGIAQIDITVYGPTRPLHSGHYGNWIPNPAWDLVHVLASMRTPAGDVVIDGYYDDATEPSSADLDAIEALPDSDRGLLDELGVRTPEGAGEPLVARMFRPSLNLRGLDGGPTGDGAANVIPTQATASIDLRLPPGHDPQTMLDRIVRHIEGLGYTIVEAVPDSATRLERGKTASVELDPHYTGMRIPVDAAEARSVVAAATDAADGIEVVSMPTLGGSVPIVHFHDVLGIPTVVMPIANHDNNQHDANENLRIGNLWYGVRLMAALLTMDDPR